MTPLVEFMELFPEFRVTSWDAWRAVLARLGPEVREFYAACGRGSGKSRIAALIACAFAGRSYRRAPGESIYIAVIAPDRRQAAVTHRYVVGLLRSVPALAALIDNEQRESVALANGITIEIITASLVAPRGRAYACVVVEEAAFLATDDQAADPDVEIVRAVRPGLARVPGSLLAIVSSPYARRGVLWDAWQRFHDEAPPDVLFVQAGTLSLNPTFDRAAVEKAYAEDPAAAAAEYGAEFRSDLESYVSVEALRRCVAEGRTEGPPTPDQCAHFAFCDPSGGSGSDSFTLAIAHGEEIGEGGRVVAVLDLLLERRPPFSPAAVTAEFAEALGRYGCDEVTGDRYAGEWPREEFARCSVTYQVSERTRSEIYLAFLPALNSGRVELLDDPKLLAQLQGLQRRAGASGRDSVDHGRAGHDDVANSAAGALALVLEVAAVPPMMIGVLR